MKANTWLNLSFNLFLLFIIFKNPLSAANEIEAKENNKDVIGEQEIPKISIRLDRNEASVGSKVNLYVKYVLPSVSKIEFKTVFQSLKGLTILDKKTSRNEMTFTIFIDKFEDLVIGPVALAFIDQQGQKNLIQSGTVTLKIKTRLGSNISQAKPKPIRDIISTSPVWLPFLIWTLVIILAISMALAIFFWLKKQRKNKREFRYFKEPHEIAISELNKLTRKKFFAKSQYKEFYFKFSEILRKYLEAIREFPAFELTTEEIGKKIKSAEDRKLVSLLNAADLVKFADFIPLQGREAEDIKLAHSYIETTKPRGEEFNNKNNLNLTGISSTVFNKIGKSQRKK